MTTLRPPHLVEPLNVGGRFRTRRFVDYVPEKLIGTEVTDVNRPAWIHWGEHNPVKVAWQLRNRMVALIRDEEDHALRFRDMWVSIHDRGGQADEAAHESSLKAVLAFELAQDARDATRPWRRVPIAVVDDEGRYTGTYDLETAADARAFLDAWSERELREHAVLHDVLQIANYATDQAYALTTQANAHRAAGETEEETESVEDWKALAALCKSLTDDVLLGWLYDDPNLLVSVSPTSADQFLAHLTPPDKFVGARKWSVPVRSCGAGTITLRNVTKALVAVSGATLRPTSLAVESCNQISFLQLRLPDDAEPGTYRATLDLTETGNPDPIASLQFNVVLPPAPVITANAGADVSVASGGTVAIGGVDTITNPEGETTVAWTRVSGDGGSLDDATAAEPTFTAPAVTEETAIVWRKTVTNAGVSASDDVTVTVTPPDEGA